MKLDIFGLEKDERVDREWRILVEKLESSGWQRESFTTLYEEGKLYIPDAPEAEMSFEGADFLFNITAFLSEGKIYLGVAPTEKSGLQGQLTIISYYGEKIEPWLETAALMPLQIARDSYASPILNLVSLFPKSFLEMPIDDELVSVPIEDPIAQKVLSTPWCRKGPCHEIILDEPERERLRNMARLNAPWT